MALQPLHRWRPGWPLPALGAWGLAWAAYLALRGVDPAAATGAGTLVGVGVAWAWPGSLWRKALVGGGFPLSLLLGGLAAGVSPLVWALPLALLAVVYPLRAWQDAPIFPTPPAALQGLQRTTAVPAGARILDAGCGLGHGLRALRAACPAARIEGIEHSPPLRWLARWRCPWATVVGGDMWALDWQGYDLVYMFQRPESMARALAKAEAQMRPGAWLASLEFAVPNRRPDAEFAHLAGKPVWLYRVGARSGAQSGRVAADNSHSGPNRRGRR